MSGSEETVAIGTFHHIAFHEQGVATAFPQKTAENGAYVHKPKPGDTEMLDNCAYAHTPEPGDTEMLPADGLVPAGQLGARGRCAGYTDQAHEPAQETYDNQGKVRALGSARHHNPLLFLLVPVYEEMILIVIRSRNKFP